MKGLKPRGALERGAASDLWRNTLSNIPSIYGRLVYLAALRDQNTGRYEHHGLALVFGVKESDRALRQSHRATFQNWLGFNLEQQKADLDLYLSEFVEDRRTVIQAWLATSPYRNLIPVSAPEAERMLFITDLETLLGLLKNEYGVAWTGPDA